MNLNIASKPHQDCMRKALVKQLQRAKTDHDTEEVQLCKDLLGLIDLKLEQQTKKELTP
jgi:hypothetical protein